MKKIGVLGAGSWGTALTWLLTNNGHEVTLWSIMEAEVEMLRTKREHTSKLPGVKLQESIQLTSNLEEAMADKDVLVLAVPSPYTRSTAQKMAPYLKKGQIVVNVAKGVEEHTLMTLSQIIEEELPEANVAVLSGPSHAEEVGKGLPTTCVVGARTRQIAEYLQEIFMSPVFRVYTSPDVLGIELGAALKNVIALAAGVADGLGYGDNTKAALITRGIAEISRLGIAMGAHARTFYGLSGCFYDSLYTILLPSVFLPRKNRYWNQNIPQYTPGLFPRLPAWKTETDNVWLFPWFLRLRTLPTPDRHTALSSRR